LVIGATNQELYVAWAEHVVAALRLEQPQECVGAWQSAMTWASAQIDLLPLEPRIVARRQFIAQLDRSNVRIQRALQAALRAAAATSLAPQGLAIAPTGRAQSVHTL